MSDMDIFNNVPAATNKDVRDSDAAVVDRHHVVQAKHEAGDIDERPWDLDIVPVVLGLAEDRNSYRL